MKRGFRVLIVALVAIGTSAGLHAAFGWCGHGQWRNHHHGNRHQGCGPSYQDGHDHDYSGDRGGCANPWNCGPKDGNVSTPKDSLQHP
jgi:hypothetical protein